jgi:hypothetical protein
VAFETVCGLLKDVVVVSFPKAEEIPTYTTTTSFKRPHTVSKATA